MPNVGIHSYRFANVAIIDVLMTILAAYFISLWVHQPFWLTLVIFFTLGVIAHHLFCVRTQVDKWLFPSKK